MMIHHVTLEIDAHFVDREVAFWNNLGFKRIEGFAPGFVRLIDGSAGATEIHLVPIDGIPVVPDTGHVAVAVRDRFEALSRRSDFVPGTRYWGARRGFVFSPSRHRVEIMETPPVV